MLEITNKSSFGIVLRNLAAKPSYMIQCRGNRKTVFIDHQKIAIYNNGTADEIANNRKISKSIMGVVRASMTRYINKNLSSGIVSIDRSAPVIYTDKLLWSSLAVGTAFYLVDARHCYWRIAYILGYISRRTYLKYCENPQYKTLRNIALAILNTSIKREYYYNGVKTHEIHCDISYYQTIYRNIRHFAYNHSGQVRAAIGDLCIAYRVDGIYTLPDGLNLTKKLFRTSDLLYKVTTCQKYDDKNYVTADGEIKKMI
jgi:hypothetical protein